MWAIPTGTSSALKKKQVKSLGIWSRALKPVRILQSGQTGNWGVTSCDNDSNLHKCDLRGRHDVDWTERHGEYIRR